MGIPVCTITRAGKRLPEEIALLTVEVRRALNRIPEATLTLLDGSVSKRTFEVSELDFFAPGEKITIALRYEGDPLNTTVFEGLVVRHSVESAGDGGTLRVELKDAAVVLTRGRKTAAFREMTDGEVIGQILSKGKVLAGPTPTTSPSHPELVQYNTTDWDFLLSRADVAGLVVDVHLGRVTAKKPALAAPVLKLDHGLGELSELRLEIDGGSQWATLEALAWDAENHSPILETANPVRGKVGNLQADTIAKKLGGSSGHLSHPTPLQPGELKGWATARLARSRWAMLRGHAVVPGNVALTPLCAVTIAGMGARFNGDALVSEVVHKLDQSGWTTELSLGLPPEPFAATPDIAELPSGGLLPPARGLHVAVVGAIDEDPTGALRVQLKLPTLPPDQGLLWARLASPDAGAGRGFVFRPEIGDEVVLGFLDEDPRQPVVLGALFSKKNKIPKPVEKPAATNHLRALVSRAGSRIVFDDSKPSLTIETTAGGDANGQYTNKIVIDESTKKISIEDQHGNKLTMDSTGIKLTSAKDFTIEAPGDVNIVGKAVNLQ